MIMYKKGFTLIELLVVIAIIGILSAVVLTSLNSSRDKAQDTKKISDVKQVALALELARDQSTGKFPTSTDKAAMKTELESKNYLNPFPEESIEEASVGGPATNTNAFFCITAELSDGSFYRASEQGSGATTSANKAPGNCDIR